MLVWLVIRLSSHGTGRHRANQFYADSLRFTKSDARATIPPLAQRITATPTKYETKPMDSRIRSTASRGCKSPLPESLRPGVHHVSQRQHVALGRWYLPILDTAILEAIGGQTMKKSKLKYKCPSCGGSTIRTNGAKDLRQCLRCNIVMSTFSTLVYDQIGRPIEK